MAEYCKKCCDKLGLDYDGLEANDFCEGCQQKGFKLSLTDKVIIVGVIIVIILSFGF